MQRNETNGCQGIAMRKLDYHQLVKDCLKLKPEAQ
jgi:hypothetical protein